MSVGVEKIEWIKWLNGWQPLLGRVTHHTNHDQETFLVLRCVRPSDDIFTTCCSHQEQISFRMYHRQRGGLVLPQLEHDHSVLISI
jgi:hypothetical protein